MAKDPSTASSTKNPEDRAEVGRVGEMVSRLLQSLQDARDSAATNPIAFPNGIDRVHVVVKVNLESQGPAAHVELKIEGPGQSQDPSWHSHNNREARFPRSEAAGLVPGPSAKELALAILAEDRIKLATSHSSTPLDDATAKRNIDDTAAGRKAKRSRPNPPGSGNPPGGEIALDESMLEGMLDLAKGYTLYITEVAGGKHGALSRHYVGVGFDVGAINGQTVSAAHPEVKGFMAACRSAGASEVLGPGDPNHSSHVHAAWARPGLFGPEPKGLMHCEPPGEPLQFDEPSESA